MISVSNEPRGNACVSHDAFTKTVHSKAARGTRARRHMEVMAVLGTLSFSVSEYTRLGP